MKLMMYAAVIGGLVQVASAQEKFALKDDKDRGSYSIGMYFGLNLKRQGVPLNVDAFVAGFKDAHSGSKTQLTQEEMTVALGALQRQLINSIADKNKAEGEQFLAENKKKEGVTATIRSPIHRSQARFESKPEGNGQSKSTLSGHAH